MKTDLFIGPLIERSGKFSYDTFSLTEGLRSSFRYPTSRASPIRSTGDDRGSRVRPALARPRLRDPGGIRAVDGGRPRRADKRRWRTLQRAIARNRSTSRHRGRSQSSRASPRQLTGGAVGSGDRRRHRLRTVRGPDCLGDRGKAVAAEQVGEPLLDPRRPGPDPRTPARYRAAPGWRRREFLHRHRQRWRRRRPRSAAAAPASADTYRRAPRSRGEQRAPAEAAGFGGVAADQTGRAFDRRVRDDQPVDAGIERHLGDVAALRMRSDRARSSAAAAPGSRSLRARRADGAAAHRAPRGLAGRAIRACSARRC